MIAFEVSGDWRSIVFVFCEYVHMLNLLFSSKIQLQTMTLIQCNNLKALCDLFLLKFEGKRVCKRDS